MYDELGLALDASLEGLTSWNLSVLQQVQSLSVDRPYFKFSLKELSTATDNFSPSKFKSHQAEYYEFLFQLLNSY